jgi:hypothetical protein
MGDIKTAKELVAQAKARTENLTPELVAYECRRGKGRCHARCIPKPER